MVGITIVKLVGGILILYAVSQVYTNLTQLLPPVIDRRRRTTWEIANWLVDYVKITLMVCIGIIFLLLK